MASPITTQDSFSAAFWGHLSPDLKQKIQERSTNSSISGTRAFIRTVHDVQLVTLEALPQDLPAHSVVVIENIDLSWVQSIGVKWQIDPLFFADHAAEHKRSTSLWHDVFGSSPADQKRPWHHPDGVAYPADYALASEAQDSQWHVDGMLIYGSSAGNATDIGSTHNLFPRRSDYNVVYGWHEISRISFLTKANRAHVILVDAPGTEQTAVDTLVNNKVMLRIPIANNRGGLVLPQMFDQTQFSFWHCLRQFLSHSWHFDMLFPNTRSPPSAEILFHLVVASTWKSNLRTLDRQIKHIAFKELRRPTIHINDRLHSCREDLVALQTQITETRMWMPDSIKSETDLIKKHSRPDQTYIGFAGTIFDETLAQSELLEKFLMDSFHLLLSSIGVVEAKASIEQGLRTQRLTQLAFLYIPLSFVTGVFGMNLQEINGSAPPLWVFFCVLSATVLCTTVAFLGFARWEIYNSGKENLRRL